jgi:hypothetical protein
MMFNREEFLKSMAMLDLLAIPFLENEEFQASRLLDGRDEDGNVIDD